MQRGDPNYRSTTRDVARLLGELQEQKVDGIIIDLRENGGGSLQEANALTGLFIESGPTVQIRHSNERVERKQKFRDGSYYAGPLLVLINRLSASASEIFAGAIQDYERGLVVGTNPGKGTVRH
jgi:carboxyl-terminal processing protease